MLLKFAYQDFLDDRRFKNTIKTNIKNYEMLFWEFVDYCIENQVVNVEDTMLACFVSKIRKKSSSDEESYSVS